MRLSTLTHEASALLRQAPLLTRGLGRRLPGREAENRDVLVLLHGFFATAGVFDPFERRVARGGAVPLASFTYGPIRTFPSLIDELAECLAGLPRSSRIHLVGHSLGGVLARWYVQELGDSRVVSTVSLASPFHGTALANRLPGPLTREMRPQSPRLRVLLDVTRIDSAAVPHTSFVASADSVVVPVDSAAFPRGAVHYVPGVGHNGILFHEDTLDHVASLVRGGQDGIDVHDAGGPPPRAPRP